MKDEFKGDELMEWKHVKQFIATGQAFIPVNTEGSGRDCVQLFFKDGTTEIIDISCHSFLKKLLIFFGTSVAANRDRYGPLICKKQLVPIALSYGFTLIPYIVRDSIGRQSRYGWVIAKEITSLQTQSSCKTAIELANHEISVHHSQKFCLDQIKNAKLIDLYYSEIHEPHRKHWPVSGIL
ncbi:hypothetical protein [Bacillus sp. FJAT-52991]|uniref:Uncharacterized protein n=1 Tax=Bacillus kandeliae TaxID=3129297 RepID=A0ABZ2NBS6_9BACI